MRKNDIRLDFLILIGIIIFVLKFFTGCGTKTVSEAKSLDSPAITAEKLVKAEKVAAEKAEEMRSGAKIPIKKDSPADTVLVFYSRLREKRFRDAILLTNLRPAIEGLTDDEMKDLGVDFGFLAQKIPAKIPINGEIVSGKIATVTVEMPDNETDKIALQKINLRQEKENWIILTVDEKAEKLVRKEGKNYFFALRIDVHHKEAKAMLDRIGKAQMIYSMQNKGRFGDLQVLINKGFVPEDAGGSVSTGYKYHIKLDESKTQYTATATPAVYGKTGKLSFALKITSDKQPELISKDIRGKSL
jgi:hypothetical protein